MIHRRVLVLCAAVSVLQAPAIVRFSQLMRVRTRIYVRRPERIGTMDRRGFGVEVPRIKTLQREGLTFFEIAAVMQGEAEAKPVKWIEPWSPPLILKMLREAEALRKYDFARGLYG